MLAIHRQNVTRIPRPRQERIALVPKYHGSIYLILFHVCIASDPIISHEDMSFSEGEGSVTSVSHIPLRYLPVLTFLCCHTTPFRPSVPWQVHLAIHKWPSLPVHSYSISSCLIQYTYITWLCTGPDIVVLIRRGILLSISHIIIDNNIYRVLTFLSSSLVILKP